ncbi:tellurite resistance TerB family protein [Falsirhodobacter sp. 20TX0035]|uniref:tellurite resistance TerB family protein n=1 Tax=Falsirhodobacter sp. 20TX0035 TaxID=3022019 RepID=UPI002330043D|nr:TerB family tellurite resistance protein [Falsirhodobacter sp. 20TX0035]MDB6452054.1 TerB family tellurite resistance protein [Falsirhodobacter sp. 20TX0035]
MFEQLLRRITEGSDTRLPEPDSRLALAALLVRIARADGQYTEVEIGRIDRVLARRHGLSAQDAIALRHQAEALEAEAPDTVRFTRALKDAVPHEDRDGLMQALWAVALADGGRDAVEDQLIRLVAKLLGVTDQESALARQKVQEG